MLETILYIVFFVSCVLLVVSVLLQPGKTDAGALFTSNVASAALNPRGTQSVLSKLTIAMAAIFMLSALMLSLPAITGNVSVLQTQGENAPANTSEGATNTNSANEGPASNSGSATSEAPSEDKPAEQPAQGEGADKPAESSSPSEGDK